MSSDVRLAPWIAATRATPRTSPLAALPSRIRRNVVASITTRPQATATRWVCTLSATSTMCAWPLESKCVSSPIDSWMAGCGNKRRGGGSKSLRGYHITMKVALFLLAAALSWPVGAAEALPELGDPSQTVLSLQQERLLGESIMRQIRASKEYDDDPELNDYINGLGYKLVASSPN